MPTYKTSQEWLEQSSLLLQARPTTTRITTKYSIKAVKPRKTKTDDASAAEDAPMTDAKPPRGSLVIKTFDPVSGVTLKYRTTKAAEVSRLVTCLGALGRTMATSKPATLDEPMADVAGAAGEDTPAGGAATPVEKPQAATGGGGGGAGGKKKKKGKK
ncbi:signal recognition particle 9 kDa protein-domain-containing protein [Colletotrichum godetiae]|uniref:Signal recognition particle 9 kDa protein-domain-containing protein n=1 Tax=Colletotrichum godetiae TaxID=1209918 RepID=A0AAJ0AEB2_9PEZI|nr:signal recognition particle 9 kDa protein-domain-containing protein [Colletotrichum godetiae]KAK1659395.1 signal recognition particle 9 kDa protein-domain-containing protein [Colletotrichum godetiae]